MLGASTQIQLARYCHSPRKGLKMDDMTATIAVAVFVAGTGINVTMLWRLYDENKKCIDAINKQADLSNSIDVRTVNLESRVTIIESQMVGWDVLKRIELYLSSLDPGAANNAIVKALKVELDSRRRHDDIQK